MTSMRIYSDTNLTPEPWMADGLCRTTSPELFFPEHGDGDSARAAKRICAACPVAPACGEYAVRTKQRHGIWAGRNAKSLRLKGTSS